jgi:hypothetical protein
MVYTKAFVEITEQCLQISWHCVVTGLAEAIGLRVKVLYELVGVWMTVHVISDYLVVIQVQIAFVLALVLALVLTPCEFDVDVLGRYKIV